MNSSRFVLTGVAIGMPVSLIATRVLAHAIPGALFEVSPSDAATCLGVVILLAAVGLAAAAVPAHRAARLDPMWALRTE